MARKYRDPNEWLDRFYDERRISKYDYGRQYEAIRQVAPLPPVGSSGTPDRRNLYALEQDVLQSRGLTLEQQGPMMEHVRMERAVAEFWEKVDEGERRRGS